jgi:positive regulator of sigma E activity
VIVGQHPIELTYEMSAVAFTLRVAYVLAGIAWVSTCVSLGSCEECNCDQSCGEAHCGRDDVVSAVDVVFMRTIDQLLYGDGILAKIVGGLKICGT